MALLKSLIQRLLDSRTTPEEAGHSAMPSATKTTFLSKDEAVGSWGTLNAGTAPADGYLFVNASAEDSTNSEVRAQLGNLFHVSAQAPAPKGLGVTIPMSKGASYTVEGAFVSHITVGFVKAIGGGYNRLVWRTLSCLRALSNFSQRSFCKVKSLGFLNSVLRLSAMAQTFLAQAPRTSLAMLHRATAGRLLGAIQAQSQLLKFKSIMGKWHLLPSSTETPLGVVSAVTSKKEPLLNSYAEAETHRIIPFGSTKQVQTLNLLSTGGALC
jgi:hypothetical protein|nr:MAG TPA: hypothetical protein [Caudoviricetes sp.]